MKTLSGGNRPSQYKMLGLYCDRILQSSKWLVVGRMSDIVRLPRGGDSMKFTWKGDI